MVCREYSTELTLASRLSTHACAWLAVCAVVASLYLVRTFIDDVPPQDHVALALILCVLLTQAWISMEQIVVKISLAHNRCWLRQRRFIRQSERSLPATQIHSAKLEYQDNQIEANAPLARIVLITSLGMIPVSSDYRSETRDLLSACERINRFLRTQHSLLPA